MSCGVSTQGHVSRPRCARKSWPVPATTTSGRGSRSRMHAPGRKQPLSLHADGGADEVECRCPNFGRPSIRSVRTPPSPRPRWQMALGTQLARTEQIFQWDDLLKCAGCVLQCPRSSPSTDEASGGAASYGWHAASKCDMSIHAKGHSINILPSS
ncbi:hypothetical protein WOLCODRAFT_24469 [Wolfiporia cocos MD-104 SS10]|uniref:Uncharacterized protein n=1 Tax=Wolfiporia cocos (strain MD-104) TaxID=742152 RepID=A0A2H3JQI2_WOLCO|nr:hypothetical protein WOLCODRAFT_24469 [Wolfiporia cocos MD-104 SS10]